MIETSSMGEVVRVDGVSVATSFASDRCCGFFCLCVCAVFVLS